jgi:hypothetical protein
MIEVIKEFLSVVGVRIRSNLFGYILLAFILINWKALFFLFFSESPVLTRLTFFEIRTDYWSLLLFPTLLGFASATFIPWVSYFSSSLVVMPTRLQNRLQHIEALNFQIEKARREAELQGIEERRKIEAAKIRDELEEIRNPQLREALVQDLDAGRNTESLSLSVDDVLSELSDSERKILIQLGNTKSGVVSIFDTEVGYVVFFDKIETRIENRQKYLTMLDALNVLSSKNILSKRRNTNEFEVTSFGYKVYNAAIMEDF